MYKLRVQNALLRTRKSPVAVSRHPSLLGRTVYLRQHQLHTQRCSSIQRLHRGSVDSLLTIRNLALSLFGGCALLYSFTIKEPRRLEGQSPQGETWTQNDEWVDTRYVPTNPPRSMVHADDMLRWQEGSSLVGGSVLRADHVEIPCNLPPEDFMMQTKATGDNGLIWFMSAIFDGHAGNETAHALQQFLVNYLVRELRGYTPEPLVAGEASQAIRKAFLDLDRDIMDIATAAVEGARFLSDAMSQVGAAYSGSCALVSYYNEESKELKVACTGDSRAILGRKDASGSYKVIPLSVDQTGHNEDEVARLQAEHPSEPDMIKEGRLLGLAVTRAFGDGRWKWSREIQEKARDRFFGHELRDFLISPPYLTAEPMITSTLIQPENGDFLIMASDGLWDKLTSDQAVDLVGRWLETHDISKAAPPPDLARSVPDVLAPSELSQKLKPVRDMAYSKHTKITEKHYVNVDENAATHLARHALGGGDEDRLTGMATALPPFARKLRDDISAQVVFFGNDPDIIETI